MDISKLGEALKGEPKYRQEQAEKAIFKDLIDNWAQATFFSLELRAKLNEICPLEIKAEIFISKKRDNIKARIVLKDGIAIESVLMRHKDGRNTVCVSSQAGCALGCEFCATGKSGFKRNLDFFEILEQVVFFSRYLKSKKEKITNLVFMGMGEPFLNYQNVMEAIKILNSKQGINLGARRISISTVGITEGIKKLAEQDLQINLAVSLHAWNDELRFELIPVAREYPVKNILKAVDYYIKKTGRRVMFEYLMIGNFNDSEKDALNLAKLMKKPLYFVNLIACNPIGSFNPSSYLKIKRFKEVLEKQGIPVTQRYRFGQDIKGACGQFSLTKHGN
jgi:23S rRNA (adenine2503-C2)-methyltransferase